ncbi:sodium/calcium exchanger regulatory protein 1-like [Amphibalanus amphitrite]|uniref:sodium/calcium exchanger regulatory protein 1-like n=1 Tax=Amphibalanus amphitrite TaxID=1232801 RepID=UPI001C91F085|nr:sodium/calcium exchanger regulatory protein 1-like [Amphibalanus amphitrite]XP_043199013.1 sodium/calcium exchanger regulatory protein 1-like [Amphibalanus amphitrite]
MVNYNGEYKLTSSENFDEYMKTVGVGMITRKAANAATPVVTVTTDGSHWKLKQVTSFKTHEQEFDIGVEQEISTADGRKVKSVVTKEGDVLTETQVGDGKTSTLVRKFTDSAMEMTVSCGDVVCKRVYTRQ